jgi:hypothetical protein
MRYVFIDVTTTEIKSNLLSSKHEKFESIRLIDYDLLSPDFASKQIYPANIYKDQDMVIMSIV